MTISARHFGWRPDPHDPRDRPLSLRRGASVPRAQEALGMIALASPVRDQRATSSCTGHSVAYGMEVRRQLDGLPGMRVSPSALYWQGRALDGFADEDAGAFNRSVLRAAHKVGAPSEAAWPLNERRINERPDEAAEVEGVLLAGGTYERIDTPDVDGPRRAELVLDALQAGCPVVFGTDVTSMFVAWSSIDTIPAPRAGDVIAGGHSMCLLGFDQAGARVRGINSWGRGWGDDGLYWADTGLIAHWRTRDVWALRPRQVTL